MSHLRPMIYLACSRLKNSGAVVQYKEGLNGVVAFTVNG